MTLNGLLGRVRGRLWSPLRGRIGSAGAAGKAGEDSADLGPFLTELRRVFLDEEAQNRLLPPDAAQMILRGSAVDQLEGGTGPFAGSAWNPAPVNGWMGEMTWLHLLRFRAGAAGSKDEGLPAGDGKDESAPAGDGKESAPAGDRLLFHRLGMITGRSICNVYEVVTCDGRHWDILFLDPYHPRRSRCAPEGYAIASAPDRDDIVFRGICRHQESFPADLDMAVQEMMDELCGTPVRAKAVRRALLAGTRFRRPPAHATRLRHLQREGLTKYPKDPPAAMQSAVPASADPLVTELDRLIEQYGG